jgi:hypothetical protein
MDTVFIALLTGLWLAMVLLVRGFKRLERPAGERP